MAMLPQLKSSIGPLVILVPGGAFGPSKLWPIERYAALADQLKETYKATVILSDRLKDLVPSETRVGPLAALESIERWLGSNTAEQRIVYLLTDFRAEHWQEPGELLSALQQLTRSQTALHFVQCADRFQPNVAISSLEAGDRIHAAGVPFFLDLAVTNHSDTPLNDVLVLIEADGNSRPALRIPRIPARQAVTNRIPMQFPSSGEHVVTAELDSDAVSVDNRRVCVVDVSADLPVLLVDGDMEGKDASYLSSALRPGKPFPTLPPSAGVCQPRCSRHQPDTNSPK